jgi:hypothetical protein
VYERLLRTCPYDNVRAALLTHIKDTAHLAWQLPEHDEEVFAQ